MSKNNDASKLIRKITEWEHPTRWQLLWRNAERFRQHRESAHELESFIVTRAPCAHLWLLIGLSFG